MKMSPSAPTERCCVHTLATNADIFPGSTTRFRLSTTMKSLPPPENFMNWIFFGTFVIAALFEKCRNHFAAHQVGVLFLRPDDVELAPFHQHLGHAGPRVIVRSHAEPVGAGAHHSEQLA